MSSIIAPILVFIVTRLHREFKKTIAPTICYPDLEQSRLCILETLYERVLFCVWAGWDMNPII